RLRTARLEPATLLVRGTAAARKGPLSEPPSNRLKTTLECERDRLPPSGVAIEACQAFGASLLRVAQGARLRPMFHQCHRERALIRRRRGSTQLEHHAPLPP